MRVHKKILNSWKIKVETQKKIAEATGLNEHTVSRAFNGRASEKTIKTIQEYFKTR